ncbi:ImmA/IrrE family metallo-endopeptidase [Arachidicoccus ginsenosidivorans]|jgi:addiction module HigA family antidote|uniref:ImmA/IrrE family metallo-endopeptidase n=1 Tax=Arachidicoccus ginsenosidivorans TaxID=496057 RepID=A0A5B8VH99_9BACT|nr:ImmA/IrrE family metallo-endopeptidase [Arachidicoccus ginsenosidivorans]QEC70957.1 ImmA/IrrE family metallo-endopeptidase [Arachidicoccus ginsenosidivorans]
MTTKQKLQNEIEFLSPPGDTISEILDSLNMSQVELADRIGKTPSKVNDIISGKEPITTNTAFKLELVLAMPAHFWLNREMLYREKLYRIQQEATMLENIQWVKQHPIKELIRYGYLKNGNKDAKMIKELLQFYSVASPQQWQNIYVKEFALTDFRKSSSYKTSTASIATWLRLGEIGFRKLDLPKYNKNDFKFALEKIRVLVKESPADFALKLKEIAAGAGVAVVYTPNLPKAPISGASRWIGSNPLIQLTDRYKSNDKFWFTFFHEAGHILLHGKKYINLEEINTSKFNIEKEQQANLFAEKWLLPANFTKDLPKKITENAIKDIAIKYKTHPAIVISRLQNLKIIAHSFGNGFKERISLVNMITNPALH